MNSSQDPLPHHSFYITGGTLPLHAPSYVPRHADTQLLQGLQQGHFCYVLNTRQMGKSSLMIRTALRLQEQGCRVAILDLTAIGHNLSVDQWYFGLLGNLALQVGREDELLEFWRTHREWGPMQRFVEALRRILLVAEPLSLIETGSPPFDADAEAIPAPPVRPLVVFVDEIDAVRSLPFSVDEFFAGIRECYNRRTQDPAFSRLTFCLLGVAAPTDLIRDTRISPFNIGRRIELSDFTPEEAEPLARGLTGEEDSGPSGSGGRVGLRGRALRLLRRVLHWTGGHPYMTQRLCQAVAARLAEGPVSVGEGREDVSLVDDLCARLFLSKTARETDDNLAFVRNRLLSSEGDVAALLDLYGQVRAGKRVRDDETNSLCGVLRLAGVVKIESGMLRVRNRIYAQVFDRQWVQASLPDAESKRQRRAYRRGLFRAFAGSSVVLILMAALAWGAYSNSRRADATATEARAETERARRMLYGANMNLIQSAWEHSEIRRIREFLGETHDYKDRGFEWYYWYRMCKGELMTLRERVEVYSVAYSPDGKQIVTNSGRAVAKIWDASSGHILLKIEIQNLYCVAFSPDSKRLVTGCGSGTATVWDVASGRELIRLRGHTNVVNAVAYSPDGKRIVTGSGDKTGRVWDAASGHALITLKGHTNGVTSVAYSPSGRRIVTGSLDGTTKLWDATTGRELLTLNAHNRSILCVAYAPDGKRIATGSEDGTATVWDAASGRELLAVRKNTYPVYTVAYSRDGKRIVTGSREDDTAVVWDASKGSELFTLNGHRNAIRCVVYSPDGKRIVTCSDDRTVKVWDAASGRKPTTLTGHTGVVCSVAFSADGGRIVTASWDKTAKVWDAASGHALITLKGHTNGVTSVAYSPNGRRIVTGSIDGTARMWDAFSGHELLIFRGHRGRVFSMAFSPDGKWIVTGNEDGTSTVWDAVSGREQFNLRGHDREVISVAYSPDSMRLVTGDSNGIAKVWDAVSGRELLTFSRNQVGIESMAFSPDGKWILMGNWNHTVTVLEAVSGREQFNLRGHDDYVASVAYSADGQRFVTASKDGTAKLWDAVSGRELLTLRGNHGGVYSVALSSDGRRIVTGNADHTATVWEAATPNQVAHWEGKAELR